MGVQATSDFRALIKRCNVPPGSCDKEDGAPLGDLITATNVVWATAGAAFLMAGILFFTLERETQPKAMLMPGLKIRGTAVGYEF